MTHARQVSAILIAIPCALAILYTTLFLSVMPFIEKCERQFLSSYTNTLGSSLVTDGMGMSSVREWRTTAWYQVCEGSVGALDSFHLELR